MPGLEGEGVVAALGSPIKKSRLSLKFFQKKETKRALDFSETQAEESIATEPEETPSCEHIVPVPCPSSIPCGKRENLVPFVGLNNLGNTCYLNSILQVLYYCPGFKDAIKTLYRLSKLKDKQKDDDVKHEEGDSCGDSMRVHMELLSSFHSLIISVEQLQSSFLINPEKYSDGELATPPRKVLNTLRQLNPMYEGFLQHDAQEVLQCILAYIQEACDTIKEEVRDGQDMPGQSTGDDDSVSTVERTTADVTTTREEDESSAGQLSGKRKSDAEAGNVKKKPKAQSKPNKSEEGSKPFTRSKRKSSGDVMRSLVGGPKAGEAEGEGEEKEQEKEGATNTEEKSEGAPKEVNKLKKRAKLSWLRSSGKQPSIFSKFRSMGKISSHTGESAEGKADVSKASDDQRPPGQENASPEKENPTPMVHQNGPRGDLHALDMLKQLFQGQLVLRTRCLECECYTERREDFQDISVPVQEDETSCSNLSSEISPDPKPDPKTLKWAISQFASVERIVGPDKYFCETCHHYTEAERSLLFDKTPEVVTIHLKCFSASGSEMDPYAGLSKVNTPLQTPLRLSLEEWSTKPTAPEQGHHYRLFAVVMHSGVTISSGHYTTYIRMTDLHHTNLKSQPPEEDGRDEGLETKSEKPGEAFVSEYDDGEVSFSLSRRTTNTTCEAGAATACKAGGKRPSEGVGLLGGQRSVSSYELGSSKQASAEKAGCPNSAPVQSDGLKKERVEGERDTRHQESEVNLDSVWQSLLDFEGKWMLFDDSEVRLFEEEEFLRACSPETCSTSTPYLLFYKKITGEIK